MNIPIHGGNYMPLDRWLVFTTIIRDIRTGVEKEFGMTAVRKEWGTAIRSYNTAIKNGYAKQVEVE